LDYVKGKQTQTSMCKHSLYEKRKTPGKKQKKCQSRMKEVRGTAEGQAGAGKQLEIG